MGQFSHLIILHYRSSPILNKVYRREVVLCEKFSTTKRGMLNFAYLFFPCLVPNSRRVKEEKDFVSVDGIFYAQLIFQFNCFKEEKFYKQYHSKFLPWIHFKSVSVAKLSYQLICLMSPKLIIYSWRSCNNKDEEKLSTLKRFLVNRHLSNKLCI